MQQPKEKNLDDNYDSFMDVYVSLAWNALFECEKLCLTFLDHLAEKILM